MKNLLIYISPTKSFNNPHQGVVNDATALVKVQIENSLELGWKPEDIMLITNFDFQYGVIKAKVLPDVEFFKQEPRSTKLSTVTKLFEKGLINKGELYWLHDLDAFQLQPIRESELEMGICDVALTDLCINRRWSTSALFFKKSAKDIFNGVREIMFKHNVHEELAFLILTNNDENIRNRVKRLNKTFNFQPYGLANCYEKAIKPLKVVHFHPEVGLPIWGIENSLDFFKGENELHIPLITARLIRILRFHRIR